MALCIQMKFLKLSYGFLNQMMQLLRVCPYPNVCCNKLFQCCIKHTNLTLFP